jgi:hypothetical protein
MATSKPSEQNVVSDLKEMFPTLPDDVRRRKIPPKHYTDISYFPVDAEANSGDVGRIEREGCKYATGACTARINNQ